MGSQNKDINQLRSYANILSNSTIDKLIRKDDFSYIFKKIEKYDLNFVCNSKPTYKDYFTHIYNQLNQQYRNEIIYKNHIVNKILLGKHSLNTSTLLNEFKVNKSIADLVLFNGKSTVFEIKTEMDSAFRLNGQLLDYFKVFQEVYLVTHQSVVDRYLAKLEKNVGVIVLTDRLTLKTIRKATENVDFDNLSILKCLRKNEYSNIIRKHFGELPVVSDFQYFSICKGLVENIPSKTLHDLMVEELKNRNVKEKEILSSDIVPEELKHICLCLNLNSKEYQKLEEILNQKIN